MLNDGLGICLERDLILRRVNGIRSNQVEIGIAEIAIVCLHIPLRYIRLIQDWLIVGDLKELLLIL